MPTPSGGASACSQPWQPEGVPGARYTTNLTTLTTLTI